LSPFWDLFILLLLFFIYTFIRYLIYGKYEINENWYNFNRLYKWIKFWNINNIFSDKKILFKNGDEIKLDEIKFQKENNILTLYLWYFLLNHFGKYLNIEKIKNYNFTKDNITFKFEWNTVILKLKKWKDNYFYIPFFKNFLKKEYSDFIWPLWLFIIIIIILIVKIIVYFLN